MAISMDDQEMQSRIYDLISNNLEIRDVPYALSDGMKEIDPASIEKAAKEITEFVKKNLKK